VAGADYRLSEHGREFQRRMAELSAAGARREICRAMAPDVADSLLGRRIVGGMLWLAGPLFIRGDWDPTDMITTIEAEDAFDVGERLGEVSAPTLVVDGSRDRCLPARAVPRDRRADPGGSPPPLRGSRARRHLRRPALRQGRRGFPESRASGVGLRRHGLVLDGAPPFENQHRFSE
jgi:hypothetical protein